MDKAWTSAWHLPTPCPHSPLSRPHPHRFDNNDSSQQRQLPRHQSVPGLLRHPRKSVCGTIRSITVVFQREKEKNNSLPPMRETVSVLDEGVGTVGVVDIAGPMMHIEHLVGLGDGAKQGVVAARTFLFLVEPHCRAFGMAPGAQHRPVEVERYARESFGHQALHDHSARLDSDFADALFIGPAERAADGGHVRQSLQAKHPL